MDAATSSAGMSTQLPGSPSSLSKLVRNNALACVLLAYSQGPVALQAKANIKRMVKIGIDKVGNSLVKGMCFVYRR
jgi:hypothetical protein